MYCFVAFGNVRRKTSRSPWQPLHWLMGYQQLKQPGGKFGTMSISREISLNNFYNPTTFQFSGVIGYSGFCLSTRIAEFKFYFRCVPVFLFPVPKFEGHIPAILRTCIIKPLRRIIVQIFSI
ncbi:hypothetical protein CEXT_84081 [Caerostris extrusa]|uniref:Uncharacterized protein n=1 Tax=Caerostris extrusa TaxID=172846 RepID=A0AAV4NLU5_CAEEX|nr:hypothetical protein CEXT_84081 [Caerostris extrusa]